MGTQDDQTRVAREVMDRAIRRLNVLEYLILGLALVLSLIGGALVAWILHTALGLPFRWGWAGASLLLFLVPGASVYVRQLRRSAPPSLRATHDGTSEAGLPDRDQRNEPKDPNG